MYKIGIIGHGPERLDDPDKVQRLIGLTIELLGFQYGEDDVVFNIQGAIGVGLWAAEACIEQGFKYHLFLPYSVEETSKHWYYDQQQRLLNQYNNAYSLTICKPDELTGEDFVHKSLIDQSNFVVFFWQGMKQGKTANAVKHAFSVNKLALNAMQNLELITARDFKRKKK